MSLCGHYSRYRCVPIFLYIIKNNYPKLRVALYLEPIPNLFKFLQRSEEIRSDYTDEIDFDLFIALDCSDLGRLGNAAKYFEHAKETLCIDHHVTNGAFAMDNYIFPKASLPCLISITPSMVT